MKATGIVRRLDPLGRVVIPIELRRMLSIDEKDSLEIFTDKDGEIVLKKYEPACIFCDNASKMVQFKGKNICNNCMYALQGMEIVLRR